MYFLMSRWSMIVGGNDLQLRAIVISMESLIATSRRCKLSLQPAKSKLTDGAKIECVSKLIREILDRSSAEAGRLSSFRINIFV